MIANYPVIHAYHQILSKYYQIQNPNLLDEILDFAIPENLFMLDDFIEYMTIKYKIDLHYLKPKLIALMVLL